MMKQYESAFITPADLRFEEGTQQSLALLKFLNNVGLDGWHTVHFEGDADETFWIFMEREVSDVAG